jgi:hypothetical protein
MGSVVKHTTEQYRYLKLKASVWPGKKSSLSKPLRHVAVGEKFTSNPVFLPLHTHTCQFAIKRPKVLFKNYTKIIKIKKVLQFAASTSCNSEISSSLMA